MTPRIKANKREKENGVKRVQYWCKSKVCFFSAVRDGIKELWIIFFFFIDQMTALDR